MDIYNLSDTFCKLAQAPEEYEQRSRNWEDKLNKLREIEEAKQLGIKKDPLKATVKEVVESDPTAKRPADKKFRRPIKWTGPKLGKSGLVEGMALRVALGMIPSIRTDLSNVYGWADIAMQEQRIFDKLIFAKAEEFIHYAANIIKDEMRHYQGGSEEINKINGIYYSALNRFKNEAGAYKDFLYTCAKYFSDSKWLSSYGGHLWAAFAQLLGDISAKLDEYYLVSKELSEIERPESTAEVMANVMKGRDKSQKLAGQIIAMMNAADGMCHNTGPFIQKMLRRENTDTGGFGSGRSETDKYDDKYDSIMATDFGAKTGRKLKERGELSKHIKNEYQEANEEITKEQLNVFFQGTTPIWNCPSCNTSGIKSAICPSCDKSLEEATDSKKKNDAFVAYNALLNAKELGNNIDRLEFVLPTIKGDPTFWYFFKDTFTKGMKNIQEEHREKQLEQGITDPSQLTLQPKTRRIIKTFDYVNMKKNLGQHFDQNWIKIARPVMLEIETVKTNPSIQKLNGVIDSVTNIYSRYNVRSNKDFMNYRFDGLRADRGNVRSKVSERVRMMIDESGHYEGRDVTVNAKDMARIIMIAKPEGGHYVSEEEYHPREIKREPEEIQEEMESSLDWRTDKFFTKTRQPQPKAEVINAIDVLREVIKESCDTLYGLVRNLGSIAKEKHIQDGMPSYSNKDFE